MSDLLIATAVLAALSLIGAAISLAEADDRINDLLAHVDPSHPAAATTPGNRPDGLNDRSAHVPHHRPSGQRPDGARAGRGAGYDHRP
ncbi:hypothetical protein GCM10010112_86920 [Actinoplanes lobatus]|uniref:Secreted protein n=1 Tax=Actinoplanes lobatus TaxID=113568 RepID=A0ABQ4AVU5_9ACTN|nr:hypothetical protein GCM10010112_86920 [Actinoplanes lobatus]GIE45156.1 hypothetical protein Alo02nite_80540 [Actinoplanes lobatus]